MADCKPGRRVLIFVEDPGAAAYLQHFPDILLNGALDFDVITTGHARVLWKSKGMPSHELPVRPNGDAILDAYKPALLVVGTSENLNSISFDLIRAAKSRGISTLGVVDAVANASERFRGNEYDPLSFAPDWLIVPDEATAEEFRKLGFDRNRIRTCGHPQYDEVIALRAKWSDNDRRRMRNTWYRNAADNRPILLFISELSTGLNSGQYRRSHSYTLRGKQVNDGRTEIVLDELLEAIRELPEKPYLVLRLHPKQVIDDLPRHRPFFDQISQSEPALEMVYGSDVVVGMTSMLLLESALLGRLTLSLVPRAEEKAWLGHMGSMIHCVWTQHDLKTELKQLTARMHEDVELAYQGGSRDKILVCIQEASG